MTKPQSEGFASGKDLSGGELAHYDRIAENILQPREFAERRRRAVMMGFPFEPHRADPFKAQLSKKGKRRSKRMPKGITPPISDPFKVSAPTHAQLFFDPLRSKSTRARLSRSSEVMALTAAAAASAKARAAAGEVEAEVRTPETPSADVVPLELVAVAEENTAETNDESVAEAILLTMADGQGPAPQHPAGPAASTSASAYYGQGRTGGGGSGPGGGSGSGGGSGDDEPAAIEPVQDDIVAGVLVAAMAVLFGWAGYNALMGSSGSDGDGDGLLSPQTADLAPPSVETLEAPAPLPPGPIDIRPSSEIVLPEEEGLQTQLRAPADPVELAQVDTTQVETTTPVTTQEVVPPAPACAPGRAMRAYFCTASANLTPTARSALLKELDDWGACASSNELVVRGYADTRGAASMNAGLASERASSVAGLLRERGYSVTEVVGVGELSDIEDERNCANQRRVDVGVAGDPPPVSTACAPPREAASLVCP